MRRARGRGSALCLGILLTVAIAGTSCGEGRQFTAEEFVEEVNAEGVKMELGEELFSEDEGQQTYAVELEEVVRLPDEGEHHGEGSLSVFDDTGAADEKIEACEATADLLCFQAANVVVVLEGGGIEAQQLGVAIERITGEG